MRYTIAGLKPGAGAWVIHVEAQADTALAILQAVADALNNGCVYVYVYDSTNGDWTQAAP